MDFSAVCPTLPAQLDLSNIEPTAMFGVVVDSESAGQCGATVGGAWPGRARQILRFDIYHRPGLG